MKSFILVASMEYCSLYSWYINYLFFSCSNMRRGWVLVELMRVKKERKGQWSAPSHAPMKAKNLTMLRL